MKLLIKNLGPIKNNTQEIDLSKQFYVFVGVNNSGKTYVSQLLWTIFNHSVMGKFTNQLEEEEIEIDIDIDIDVKQEIEIKKHIVFDIIDKFSDFIKNELTNIYNVSGKSGLLHDLDISFDFGIDELERREIEITFDANIRSETISSYFAITKKANSLILKVQTKKLPKSVLEMLSETEYKQNQEHNNNRTVKKAIVISFLAALLNHRYKTFFLPSNRSFYPSFYRYIYDIERRRHEEITKKISNLLEETEGNPTNKDIESLRNSSLFTRPYTQPINQAIEAVYSLNINPEEVSHYTNLVERLAEVMGGDIVMKSLEGIAPIEFFFKPHKQETDLPMYLASSSVNQLSLLYLYLKYWVVEDSNFLMMDEPEENLHPANQAALLELLLDFANQNDNRVLITTHSPLLANALNNYVYLDILKNEHNCDLDDIIEEHNLKYISSSTSIARKDVGVYFFTGDRIVEYNSGHYSISFRDFQEVTSAIDECADVLTDYIYLKGREEDDDE